VKILSLGIALPDQQVDNYGWAGALSFFDYDAIVVDPMVAVSEFIEGVVRDGMSHTTYNEEVVENGSTTAFTVGLADLLHRRADETERLLGKGGLVVCFAYPDVPHPRVANFTGCHRYYWLPAPAGLSYSHDYLKPAAGTEVVPADYEHPFADFLERHRTTVQYRAIFAEGNVGIGEGARVIARSPGGAALGLDVSVGGGRIVFLPAVSQRLSSADRTALATSIVTGVRNLLLTAAEGPAPAWVSGFDLPGLKDAAQRIDAVESRLEEVENELDEARNSYRGLDRYRRILWQEGKYGLDLPVRDALSLLGMTAFVRPDEPAVFSYGGSSVIIETEGSGGEIGLAPHYRLRQRIESYIAERKDAPRALLVLNGHRNTPPASRPRQYADELAVAAETMRYCVIETTKLFAALRAKMAGDDEGVSDFLSALVETEGVYDGPLPQVKEPPVSEEPEAGAVAADEGGNEDSDDDDE
jgi:hypothetical protein